MNSMVTPYAAPAFGNYQLYMNNGLCNYTTPGFTITDRDCYDWCSSPLLPTFNCNDDIPGRYDIALVFDTRSMDGAVSLSTEQGPIFPSIIPFTSSHPGSVNLEFNSMIFPTPALIVVVMFIEYEDGSYCASKMTLSLPDCDFDPQRAEAENEVTGNGATKQILGDGVVRNALSVYPNPSTYSATVQYDYGAATGPKSMEVYDIAGRKIGSHQPGTSRGEWRIDTKEWKSGIYLIRMQSGSQTLHTFKLVVSH